MSAICLVAPAPDFRHLVRMTDHRGLFEHADHTTPRRELGYCTDDMARLLVVTSREPHPDPVVGVLARNALRFLVSAQGEAGDCHNRMDSEGRWQDRRTVEDCWGRSLWGLGTAAARSPDYAVRQAALTHFERGTEQRSRWPRAMAFAALGAAEVVAADRDIVMLCRCWMRPLALSMRLAPTRPGRGRKRASPTPTPFCPTP
jgi:hypothetical protein